MSPLRSGVEAEPRDGTRTPPTCATTAATGHPGPFRSPVAIASGTSRAHLRRTVSLAKAWAVGGGVTFVDGGRQVHGESERERGDQLPNGAPAIYRNMGGEGGIDSPNHELTRNAVGRAQCRVTIPTAGVSTPGHARLTDAEFCTHAVNTLEDVILEAIRQNFTSLALTEHMPRDRPEDLYPEEKHLTPADLHTTFARYYAAAVCLRKKYAAQIPLLIGFETEYIRPESVPFILRLEREFEFDFCVGSIHHVRGIPIDYDSAMWEEAAGVCGGLEGLFAAYFDEQYELLRAVKPLVVGHFDVIRLWAPDKMVRLGQWEGVWEKVVRNIELVIEYGGAFELNSAAFRKGFDEPYPTSEIAAV